MNDRLNAPVEPPDDDGSVQDDPLYQAPSEGISIGNESEPAVTNGEAAGSP